MRATGSGSRVCRGCGTPLIGRGNRAAWCDRPECRRAQNHAKVSAYRARKRAANVARATRKPAGTFRARVEVGQLRKQIDVAARERLAVWCSLPSANGNRAELVARADALTVHLEHLYDDVRHARAGAPA